MKRIPLSDVTSTNKMLNSRWSVEQSSTLTKKTQATDTISKQSIIKKQSIDKMTQTGVEVVPIVKAPRQAQLNVCHYLIVFALSLLFFYELFEVIQEYQKMQHPPIPIYFPISINAGQSNN